MEAQENKMAEKAVKGAALKSKVSIFHLTSVIPPPSITLKFCLQEEKQLSELGDFKTPEGKWILPDGREMITKPIRRKIISHLCKGSHWGRQAMCDVILRKYGCMGIYTISKQVTENCLTCRKVNKQV
jgi:hypothetical protein